MVGARSATWRKRLGNGGLIVGFVGMELFSVVHRGYHDWAEHIDDTVFNAASRYYPTSTLIAAGTAFVLGAIGFLVGWLVDRAK